MNEEIGSRDTRSRNCLVKAHRAGLWSLINNVITCMDLYEHGSVDWSDCIYGPVTWHALFEPTPPPMEPFDTISSYPDQWLTYKNAAELYRKPDIFWRKYCNLLWKRLGLLRIHSVIVDDYVASMFPRPVRAGVVAALIRADTHAGEQLSGKSQLLDEYAVAIEYELKLLEAQALGCGRVYIASNDNASLDWMRERFPVIYYPHTLRSPSREIDRHLAVRQTPADAENCLREVLIMSRANVLIHPVSNMATAALYINPQLKSVYLP